MPGYVFVAGKHFSAFRRDLDGPDAVPHCVGWLSGADGPEPVKTKVIEDIKAREQRGEFDSSERIGKYWAPRWLKPKAKVRINDGPFSGKAGDVWRMTGARRVAIWVLCMGRPTLTEVPIEAVSRAR
jgi:transcription antitermination factor NusG